MIPDGIASVPCGACGEPVVIAVLVTPGLAIVGEYVEDHQCAPKPDPAATLRP